MPAAIFLSPEDAEHAFYEALRTGDTDTLMDVWSEDEEIVCIHPSGPRQVGPAAIRTSWRQILANGGMHVSVSHLQVAHNPLCAVHNVLEQVQVETHPEARYAFVLATNVYLKQADGWRLVLHHASPAIGHEDNGSQMSRTHRLH